MKGVKKLLSILMVLTLVMSLGATAFAATVTIDDRLEGHTFTAYQIFKGVNHQTEDNTLGNIEWGTDIDAAKFVEALNAMDEFSGLTAGDAAAVAKAIGDKNAEYDSDLAKKIADAAADCLTGAGKEFTESTTLDEGYYLIKDTTPSIDGADAYNDVVLQVTTDVTVAYKTDVPTSDKSVKDSNDTEGSETDWQKTGDWDIGDHVPFQLKGTLPSNYGDYTEYYLAFHDEQENGLTFESGSVHVYLDGVEITEGFEVVQDPEDGCTFEVVFDDMKDVANAKAGSVITVEYTAVLNENAIIGNPGNHNKSQMEFSNDSHSDSHGKTPEVTVVVFTYDLNVDKVDQDLKPLTGAEFELYKVDNNGTIDPSTVDQLKEIPDLAGKKLTKVELAKDADGDSFYGKGLDDGDYWIIETVTPPGYNTIDPKNFTVSAEHNDTITNLEGTGDFHFTLTATSGAGDNALGQADIQNQMGPTLPETGGIGTTIFYVVGAVLVAGAVILLVTKKRVSGMEK